MRTRIGIGIGLLLIGLVVRAQERVTLTTPQVTTNAEYHIASLLLEWDTATITVQLAGTNGEPKTCGYVGPTATALMVALNKANLTTRSLMQRVFDRLIADGCLVGTVSGSVP